jgi:hypothetical protein
MKYINPQLAYDGMLAGQRNMFLASSIGITIIGFSDRIKDKKSKLILEIFGITLFFLSIVIGIKTNRDYDNVLKLYEKNREKSQLNIKEWHHWSWIINIFIIMSLLLIIIYAKDKISYYMFSK